MLNSIPLGMAFYLPLGRADWSSMKAKWPPEKGSPAVKGLREERQKKESTLASFWGLEVRSKIHWLEKAYVSVCCDVYTRFSALCWSSSRNPVSRPDQSMSMASQGAAEEPVRCSLKEEDNAGWKLCSQWGSQDTIRGGEALVIWWVASGKAKEEIFKEGCW